MERNHYAMLSLSGRTDIVAAAIRFRAARKFAGIGQEDLAAGSNRSVSNISNMERARSYPALDAIMYLWRNHRVDANFIYAGAYSQLPADVVDGLMIQLGEEIAATDLLNSSEKPPLTAPAQQL